jgi:thiosulfate/3-mercaptopyruvate sulfurtransferase
VIDSRQPDQYATNHLPGAIYLSGFGGIPRAANGDMASPDEFAKLAVNLGISNDMTVVVYDDPSQTMGMVAWAFLYYGHPDVRILDGGIAKWSRENRPVTTEVVDHPPAIFIPKPQESLCCSLNQAKVAVSQPKTVFWDTRSTEEFEGARAGNPTHPDGWDSRRSSSRLERPVRPEHEDAQTSRGTTCPPCITGYHA